MIKGKRVVLRAIEESDLELMVEWLNDPAIAHMVVGFSFPTSRAQQAEWFRKSTSDRDTQRWIVADASDGSAIGLTGLWNIDWHNRHALTALKIGPQAARGKGLGTDAILTVMAYAFFQVGLNRLWSEILPYNVASYKAYVEKCGWRVEGLLREHVYRDGSFYDLLRVAALRSDFEKHPGARDYGVQPESVRISVLPEHMTPLA